MSRTGATIFGCEGLTLGADEKAFFHEAQPFGFILFARNVSNPDQIRRLTSDLRASVGRNAPILIDQEGGRVQRMRAPQWREWLPPLDEATLAGPNAARSFYLRYRLIAHELLTVGIDANCAPSGDIATSDTHVFLRNRCYGEDVETVAQLARAAANGLMDGGVLPIMKHVPGHGRGSLDSHKELPRVITSKNVLDAADFAAFRAINDLPMGMSAHIVFEDIDPTGPSTTSRIMTDLIRNDIGFDGLLMTDDLSMEALSGDVIMRSRESLAAGMDVVLHCNGNLAEMQLISAEVGALTTEASQRAERALESRKPPTEIDVDVLWAEHQSLVKG
ncbi:MAG: glycoside hydrolase family 3 N-terminal domain-containing protein [Pseudoruegeria sp.]